MSRDRKPKDRDFIRTPEGMFFCVTGYLHPPDRYTAYLKYSPAPRGRWRKGTTAYRREIEYYHAQNVGQTIRYLEETYPQYVHDCPVRGIRFSMVPQEHVARYYVPQERLQAILDHPQDRLEREAADLAREIATCAGISLHALGVTGSILIELHNPDLSDINLLVYGAENARAVQAALQAARSPRLHQLQQDLIERWVGEMVQWFPLTIEEARYNVSRRWNYGLFGTRFFGIHPTRSDAEIHERYGDHVYRSAGGARIQAVVSGTEEALFQPAVYEIAEVQVLEGDLTAVHADQIVCYEGRYRAVAAVGQRIEAYGKLEHALTLRAHLRRTPKVLADVCQGVQVAQVDGAPRRLVIGTTQLKGAEYLKPLI